MTDDTTPPTVAVFRPADDRLDRARSLLAERGARPLADPMLAVDPTGRLPRTDADVTILTSTTGVELVADAGWEPRGRLCAIGETTAAALRDAGYAVAVVPGTYTSAGLVDRLQDEVGGSRVEIARSDHGSDVLIDGLNDAGAYVHETILYRLDRPPGAGESVDGVLDGAVDAVLFSSSLTVEHFLEAATERGEHDAVVAALEDVVVGAIGPPTAETASNLGIAVDVVPGEAEFAALVDATLAELDAD